MASKSNTTTNVLTHILALFFNFVAPLIIFLSTENKTTKQHAANALNWQISVIIYSTIAFILVFVLVGVLLLWVLAILNTIFCIVAAVKASEGKLYKYPMTVCFVSA